MNCLEIDDLWKSYQLADGETLPVLQGLNLTVAPGETVAVMGPSGSGKTTLLNLIGGIDHPDRGSVSVAGLPLGGMDQAQAALFRRRMLGMVFQDFQLLESLTVRENILVPMILDARPAEEQDRRAQELMEAFGIAELGGREITAVSGGQKQRAAICRALANRPALLLADEPTGSLDAAATAEVMRCFARVSREFGAGGLLVTHDAFAASCCRRAVFLQDGTFAAEKVRTGTRREFLGEIAAALAQIGGGQDDLL